MKKIAAGLGIALLLTGVCVLLYAGNVVRSLDTPEFKAQLTRKAGDFVGAPVAVESLEVSLLSGIRLVGIRIQTPPGFQGDLLTAEEARLEYRPWSLLRGQIQVTQLKVLKPVITLATNPQGVSNFERLSAAAPGAKSGPPSPPVGSSVLPGLVISDLSVENARFSMTDAKNVAAFRLDGATLDSALAVESGILSGTGSVSVESVIVADALFLRNLRAPLTLSKARLRMSPLQAQLGGGKVSGDIDVEFKRGTRYALQIEASGARVAALLREAGSAGTLDGALSARANVEGTGGVATLKGSGQAQITDCRWPKAAIFGALATVLQIPELGNPRFEECRVEFTLGEGQARTPVVSFKGPALELTGRGAANLVTSVLDYDLTLALSPGLLAKAPATMRAGFKTRPDGFGTIAFSVTGTMADPNTDLAARFGKSLAIEAAKEGLLGRLFGSKK